MTSRAPADLEPESLGRYKPIAILGRGGMARVQLAIAQGPAGVNKLLVLKEIRPELAHDVEFVTMFMDEARLAARLSHRNVLHTYEVGLEPGDPPRPFMVMEYLEGQSLQALTSRIGRSRMPLAIHLAILTQALAGLHYAHELADYDGTPLHVVHRDVSPQNVFVCYDGQVKIVDFGIAKVAGAVSRTETGVFKGKLGYIAPEQIAAREVDRRADIYSVGIILWEALTQRRLTSGDIEAVVISKRTHGDYPSARALRPEVPEALSAVAARAMAPNPDDRFATAAEMQAALESAMESTGLRAGVREVGALCTEAFATERERIRAIIERQVALASASATGELAAVSLPGVREESVSMPPPSLPSATPPEMDGAGGGPASFTVTRKDELRPRRVWALAGGGVVLAGILGAVVVLAMRDTSTPAATRAAGPVPSPPPAPASASAPAPATIDLHVSAAPAAARITLDGTPVSSNPFHVTLKRDDSLHRVSASAPGFVTEDRMVAFDKDVSLDLSLQRAAVHGPPVAPPPVAAPSASAATGAKPGDDLGAGTNIPVGPRPKHTIDEKDPYK